MNSGPNAVNRSICIVIFNRGLGRSEGDVLLFANQLCNDTDLCHLFFS